MSIHQWGEEITWTGGTIMPIYVRPNDDVLVDSTLVRADELMWSSVKSFRLMSDHVYYYGKPRHRPAPTTGGNDMKVTIERDGATMTLDQYGDMTTSDAVEMFVGAMLAQTYGARSIADALYAAAEALEE